MPWTQPQAALVLAQQRKRLQNRLSNLKPPDPEPLQTSAPQRDTSPGVRGRSPSKQSQPPTGSSARWNQIILDHVGRKLIVPGSGKEAPRTGKVPIFRDRIRRARSKNPKGLPSPLQNYSYSSDDIRKEQLDGLKQAYVAELVVGMVKRHMANSIGRKVKFTLKSSFKDHYVEGTLEAWDEPKQVWHLRNPIGAFKVHHDVVTRVTYLDHDPSDLLLGHCPHKIAAQCRLIAMPLCCACADKRPHTTGYLNYVDGKGDGKKATRRQVYCTPCQNYWEGIAEASGVGGVIDQDLDAFIASQTLGKDAESIHKEHGLRLDNPPLPSSWSFATRSMERETRKG